MEALVAGHGYRLVNQIIPVQAGSQAAGVILNPQRLHGDLAAARQPDKRPAPNCHSQYDFRKAISQTEQCAAAYDGEWDAGFANQAFDLSLGPQEIVDVVGIGADAAGN